MPSQKDWQEWQYLFDACKNGTKIYRLSDIRKGYILNLEMHVKDDRRYEADKKLIQTKEIAVEMAWAMGIVDFTDDEWDGNEKIDYWEIICRFQKTIHDLYPERSIKLNFYNRTNKYPVAKE